MKFYKLFYLSILFIAANNEAMNNSSKVSKEQFKELACYTKSFLKDNITRLSCQKNESGFIRINVPLNKEAVTSISDGIKKLRLNLWVPDANVSISPESIHNHPNYFESMLINGGYTHSVYEVGKRTDEKYEIYRIIKDNDRKSIAFIGKIPLKHTKDEEFKAGDIAIFPLDLIHRVLRTKPQTLSLNVVFEDAEEDKNFYNVYLSKNGVFEDVKTEREMLSNVQSRPFIKQINEYINNFIQNKK